MSKRVFVKILILLLGVLCPFYVGAQESPASKEIKPSIGLGVGFLNYYGDVNSIGNHSSIVNQFGYEVHIARKISDFSDLGFSFLTGTMLGNERSPERNLNFRTDIYSISVYGTFSLNYWLNWSDIINPYVTIGFESFEYNNKADLVNANGAPYHYWSDGTIRNLAESSINASQSSLMFRDYNYETDLRAADLDGFGKYPQLAIAVPVGLGVNLNVSDRLSFKINSTFHYTFTDLIDNVSKNGKGVRKGNELNDYFTFNSVSIYYDLIYSPPKSDAATFKFPDYFVLDVEDEDGDGVVDGLDFCHLTPIGVKVDENGCALDDDDDGVPNYLDIEQSTKSTSFVGANGKTLTDADLYQQYLKYIDSADIPIEVLYRIAEEPQEKGNYRILLGEYSGELPNELAKRFIDEGDVIGTHTGDGNTAYLTKKYGNLKDAEQRRKLLAKEGFPTSEIVVWDGDNYFSIEEWENKSEKYLKNKFADYFNKKEVLEDNYALKLGEVAPDALTVEKAKFFEYEDVVVLDGDSSKSDFLIGPFINKVSAKQSLEEVDRNKYPNAEVVKVNNSKAKPIGIEVNSVAAADVVGPSNWNSKKEKVASKVNAIKNLEGKLVIDFGEVTDSTTQSVLNKINSQVEIVEVDGENGEQNFITKKPQSDSYVREKVDAFSKQGILAEVKRIENGSLVPVDTNILIKAEKKAFVQKQTKEDENGILANLEGEFVVDFGNPQDLKVKGFKDQIENLTDIQEVKTASGEKRLISKEPKTVEEAAEIKLELKKTDLKPALVEIKEGNLIPVNNSLKIDKKSKDILSKLEGSFAIDFGQSNDSKIEAKKETILAKTEAIDVKTKNGEEKYISKQPKTESEAKRIINDLKKEGVEAELVKVEGGEIIQVNESKVGSNDSTISQIKYDTSISEPKVDEDGPLIDLEGNFAIDFGNTETPEKLKVFEKLRYSGDFKETGNIEGNKILIAKTPEASIRAKEETLKLKNKGQDISPLKVENGRLVKANFPKSIAKVDSNESNNEIGGTGKLEELFSFGFGNIDTLSKNIDSEKLNGPLDSLENNYVIKVGTIYDNTPLNERSILLNAPGTFQIKNNDGSIDIISNLGKKTEEESFTDKSYYQGLGFKNSKVAYFRDGEADVIRKEELEGKYTVSVGSFKSDLSNEEVNNILSVPNIEAIETKNPNMTTYVLGEYDTPAEAKASVEKLINQGLDPSVINFEKGKINAVDLGLLFKKEELAELNVIREQAKLIKTDKVIFRVQLGAYRQKIDRNIFKGVNTLSFPTAGGVTKYVTGSNSTYQQAYIQKLEMKKMGFSGAFVVAYKDGKRIKVTDLVDQDKYQMVKQSVSPIEQSLNKVTDPKNNFENGVPKFIYKVQIGAYKDDDEPADELAQFTDVEMEIYGQYKRYMSGEYENFEEANSYKKIVQEKGFLKAFVVAYSNGERVAAPGQEANVISQSDLSNKKAVGSSANANEPVYMLNKVSILVQVGLYKGEIPEDLRPLYASLPNLTKQVTVHGVTRYMTGEFKNLSEAAAYKEELIKQGFPDAFLVAYYDSDRVKISEIVEIMKTAR